MQSEENLGAFLDPQDWGAFRRAAHELLDSCIDRLCMATELPWRPVPNDVRKKYSLAIEGSEGSDPFELITLLRDYVLPYGTGNTHPRFYGWVHGTGLAEGILSEMVAATMNSNCGGRDHGMVYLEREVIEWSRKIMSFPETASGVLVSGTSQATVIALSVARTKALGNEGRTKGQECGVLTLYAGQGAHNSVVKAAELLGIGSDNLRLIPEGDDGIDLNILKQTVARDRNSGLTPLAVIGTAGSVDFGRFDNLNALADLSAEEKLWLHVDGAFGAWTRLADDPWRGLSSGIERADSIACDFHKWMYVPYDCGLVLVRNEEDHRAAFAIRPSYLASSEIGLAGGEPWYCDYGVDLSRGARALKVWAAVKSHGSKKLGQAISANCRQARYMAELVECAPEMELMRPVISNVCVFTAYRKLKAEEQSKINIGIAQLLQLRGDAVFSTVSVDGITCLRAAITNHRTRSSDIEQAIAAVRDAACSFMGAPA